jgi:hypothetical protein
LLKHIYEILGAFFPDVTEKDEQRGLRCEARAPTIFAREARDLVVTELDVDPGVRNREYGSSCAGARRRRTAAGPERAESPRFTLAAVGFCPAPGTRRPDPDGWLIESEVTL